MKIVSIRGTKHNLSRIGRVLDGAGHAVAPGVAVQVELDAEVERCARITSVRGTWMVLEQPKPNLLVLVPSIRYGRPKVGEEFRIGFDAPETKLETEREVSAKPALKITGLLAKLEAQKLKQKKAVK